MLEIGSKVGKLMVGIIVIFLLMLETEVVLSSTRALSKSPEAGFSVWIEENTVKIKPDDPVRPTNSQGVVLKAAKNEYEPFQLIVTATAEELKNVKVGLTALIDGKRNKIEQKNIKMFREWYINCRRPSDELGEAGEWPDPFHFIEVITSSIVLLKKVCSIIVAKRIVPVSSHSIR